MDKEALQAELERRRKLKNVQDAAEQIQNEEPVPAGDHAPAYVNPINEMGGPSGLYIDTEADNVDDLISQIEGTAPTKKKRKFNVAKVRETLYKKLEFATIVPETKYYLDTGNKYLNECFGTPRGLAYGKGYELCGAPSGGKSLLAQYLAGLAQQEGAGVTHIDVGESSWNPAWARNLGLNPDEVYDIQVKMGRFGPGTKSKDETLQSAEDIFLEAEAAMDQWSRHGYEKQFLILDCIANVQPRMVLAAGPTGQNMRTNSERSMFLSKHLPRWNSIAANKHVIMLMLNQIRTRPGAQKWEDPEYSPGGNAMEHFCNSRNKVHRFINSRITDNKKSSGKLIGIQGVVKNFKNKVGDGSLEGNAVGFRIMFGSGPIDERIKFYSLADYKLLNKKKDEEEGDDY